MPSSKIYVGHPRFSHRRNEQLGHLSLSLFSPVLAMPSALFFYFAHTCRIGVEWAQGLSQMREEEKGEDQNTHHIPASAQKEAPSSRACSGYKNPIDEGTTTTDKQNGSTPFMYMEGWRLHVLTIGLVYISRPKKNPFLLCLLTTKCKKNWRLFSFR